MSIKRSMHLTAAVMLVAALLIGLLPARHGSADVGPVQINPQGGSLLTGDSNTNVEMEYEKVTLTYSSPQRMPYYGSYREYMPVHVTGVFRLRNTSDKNEAMDVYFPASDDLFVGGYNEMENQITNFRVNGGSQPVTLTTIPTNINGKTQNMPAYYWHQEFMGKVTYTLYVEYDTTSAKNLNVYYLTYVLGTGRGWKGPIGKADISFVMPQNITSDMVISNAPLIEKNKLPYKVSGNSINFTLTEYEPEANDAIAIGIYDPDIFNSIEGLKKQPATLDNLITIANNYRNLSAGPHCIFCTGSAAQKALDYYSLALDKAGSKDELNKVLMAFAYGGSTYPTYTLEQIFSYLKLAKDPDCKISDGEFSCSDPEKDKQLNDMYAIHVPMYDLNNSKAFLTKYSCKIRAYDKEASTTVDNFLGETSDCTAKNSSDTNKKRATATKKNDNKKRIIIISSSIILGLGVAAITAFMIIRRRHTPSK